VCEFAKINQNLTALTCMNVVYTAYKSSSNSMLIFVKNKHNHTACKRFLHKRCDC